MAALAVNATSCSHCGELLVAFKRCSVCKQAVYCNAECQKAAWKKHKKMCAPPRPPSQLPVPEVWTALLSADATSDWRGVLKWEGRQDEIYEGQPTDNPDEYCYQLLSAFSRAHARGMAETGNKDHALPIVRFQQRLIVLMGKMERFKDQGKEMCVCAQYYSHTSLNGREKEAARYYKLARAVHATHGFYSVECQACLGLGELSIGEGRQEEGVELLHSALTAASLSEEERSKLEARVCCALADARFKTTSYDELEELIPRFQEASKAESLRLTHPCIMEMSCVVVSARVHEARGWPQEAAKDVRTLLDLMHDIERRRAAKQDMPDADPKACQTLLQRALKDLKIFRKTTGDKELTKAVNAELAKLNRLV